MGRRTHKHQIPDDAYYLRGKVWTRLMIMRYTGLSAHKYREFTKDRDPLSLLEWGAYAYREKRRRITFDTSKIITCNGVSLTVMQWFYLAIKETLYTPIDYRTFRKRLDGVKMQQNMSGNVDGLALQSVLQMLGVEHIINSVARRKNDIAYMSKIQNEYLDYINDYHQQMKDDDRELLSEQPPDPNERWFECLLADTRLQWLFYEEYEKEIGKLNDKLKGYKEANDTLANELGFAKQRLAQMEKQIADIRRSKTVDQFTKTE